MVNIRNEGDKLFAYISGDIDHHASFTLRTELDLAIEKAFPTELYMDFSKVGFMDSSGVGLIMGRYKLIRSMGGRIYIVNPSLYIERLMRMAGLEQIVEFKKMEEMI